MIKISDFTIQPTSLQQKTALFVLLPTFLILISVGYLGLRRVRTMLLEQWQETAIARLQQTAHHVDMQLLRPKELLRLLQDDTSPETRQYKGQLIIEQLNMLDGVVQVNTIGYPSFWDKSKIPESKGSLNRGLPLQQSEKLEITAPKYDKKYLAETISLVSALTDKTGQKSTSIEVVISFNTLIDELVKASWWKSNKAFLIDRDGNILASTTVSGTTDQGGARNQKFGDSDPLEKQALAALQTQDFGTVFGPGKPPENISGFCRLNEAPWIIVLSAPGERVLQPIIKFVHSYILLACIGILLALFYLRTVISRTTHAIRRVSEAASDLANGAPAPLLAVHSRDEIGELTRNFNTMAEQLQERMQLQEAMHVAKEIQQNLLPLTGISMNDIDAAGVCIYCDETGGDFFDLFITPGNERRMSLVVGDVAGHGIGAAILMATVRALLRSRVCQSGTSAQIINDVNKLLCIDTVRSGNFATLFLLTLDLETRIFNWVRCGHEPALVYTPRLDTFSELRGEGLALGVDSCWQYSDNTLDPATENQIILLGSDGVWEAENSRNERFGKQRIKDLLIRYQDCDPKGLLEKITSAVFHFRDGHPQLDDITLVVLKTGFSLDVAAGIVEKLDNGVSRNAEIK